MKALLIKTCPHKSPDIRRERERKRERELERERERERELEREREREIGCVSVYVST